MGALRDRGRACIIWDGILKVLFTLFYNHQNYCHPLPALHVVGLAAPCRSNGKSLSLKGGVSINFHGTLTTPYRSATAQLMYAAQVIHEPLSINIRLLHFLEFLHASYPSFVSSASGCIHCSYVFYFPDSV